MTAVAIIINEIQHLKIIISLAEQQLDQEIKYSKQVTVAARQKRLQVAHWPIGRIY